MWFLGTERERERERKRKRETKTERVCVSERESERNTHSQVHTHTHTHTHTERERESARESTGMHHLQTPKSSLKGATMTPEREQSKRETRVGGESAGHC